MALYFAYASCMNQESLYRSGVQATYLGTATLYDYQLAFTRYSRKSRGGVADIVPRRDSVVVGVLYDVPNFLALDKREGAPHTYRRRKVRVRSHEEKDWLDVWTYEVVHKKGPYSPSPRYARIIWDGAQRLPLWYRRRLQKRLHIKDSLTLAEKVQDHENPA